MRVQEVGVDAVTRLDTRSIGRAVQRSRLALRMDQAVLAERAGLSRAYISRLEHGYMENPSIIHIEQVARGLGMTLIGLLSVVQPATGPTELHFEGDLDQIRAQLAEAPPAEAEALIRGFQQVLAMAEDLKRARDGEPAR